MIKRETYNLPLTSGGCLLRHFTKKMTKAQATEVINRNEQIVILSTYNILFTNDICCSLIIEATNAVKKSPLYKQKVKKMVNELEKSRKNYERTMNEIIGDRSEFFAEANDFFVEDINTHLMRFRYAIKNVLDKHFVRHSDVLSWLEMTLSLCEFARLQYDHRIGELVKCDASFSRMPVDYMRLSEPSRIINLILDEIKIGKVVNLNTEECQRGFNILMRMLADPLAIAKAINDNNVIE